MKLFIAGHQGMVGAALVRRLAREPGVTLLLRTRRELDLASATAVDAFYAAERPDAAIIAAAKVGGIHANNTYPADFLFDNLAIAANTIHGAFRAGVPRLLFLGSSCIYPKHAPQPMPEDCLLTGPLEPTNEAYAIAKIAGLKLAQAYRKQHGVCYHSAMPTNLYGPADNYHPLNSHVLPALIRRFDEARAAGLPEVVAWGTGTPRREFLHVEDLARACRFLLEHYDSPEIVNVGVGEDIAIGDLAALICEILDYQGALRFDATKPDGTPRKLLDVSRIHALGWRARISLRDGIRDTCQWYLDRIADGATRAVDAPPRPA